MHASRDSVMDTVAAFGTCSSAAQRDELEPVRLGCPGAEAQGESNAQTDESSPRYLSVPKVTVPAVANGPTTRPVNEAAVSALQ
jgi:hypothetical protein